MDNNFKQLSDYIISIFSKYFEVNITLNDFCIHNDPDAPYPMLITDREPLIIRTCVKTGYWSQFAYQFSHELTHFVIRNIKIDKDKYLKWFEETICESISLFIVKILAEYWDFCPLYDLNNKYDKSMLDYFENEYKKCGSKLKNCKSIYEIKRIEETCEEIRSERFDERNILYNIIIKFQKRIKIIFDYTNYVHKNNLLINFDMWVKEKNEYADVLNEIRKIQPINI
jgi:hypothetical protein